MDVWVPLRRAILQQLYVNAQIQEYIIQRDADQRLIQERIERDGRE